MRGLRLGSATIGVLLRFALAAMLIFALNLALDPGPGRLAAATPSVPLTNG
jgi:hypothetical protein